MVDIKDCIEKLVRDFKKNPLHYFTEGDMVSKFYYILKNNLLLDDIDDINVNNAVKYRNESLKKIAESTITDPIHVEVPLKFEEDHKEIEKKIGNRRIDIAILKQNGEISYSLENGSKKWFPKDFSTAIEIKFIKNTANLNDTLKNRFEKDLEKLSYFTDADKYLLIFSHKNIFENNPDWLKDKSNEDTIIWYVPFIGDEETY